MLTSSNITTNIQNDINVETEIYLINISILTNSQSGNNSATIKNSTVTTVSNSTVTGSLMTNDLTYYSVWQGTTVDNRKSIEMQKVIDNFTQLGYTISRKSDDMEYLYWQVNW